MKNMKTGQTIKMSENQVLSAVGQSKDQNIYNINGVDYIKQSE